MIYLKEFATAQDYEAVKSNLPKPNVSLITDGNEVKYMKNEPTPSYDWVDLGLPSGTKWRKMNVGAETETDYGDCYMYGLGSKTYDENDSHYQGTEDPLSYSVDTARQVLGGDWHMPTSAQCQELIDNTTLTWEENFNGSGVSGGKFTAQNGNYVFFPAGSSWYNGKQSPAGGECTYWTSTPYSQNQANWFDIWDEGYAEITNNWRTHGYSIRPVKDAE